LAKNILIQNRDIFRRGLSKSKDKVGSGQISPRDVEVMEEEEMTGSVNVTIRCGSETTFVVKKQ
jgi:hypothetical protein